MFDSSEKKKSQIRCPLCGSTELRVFYSALNVPASCNRLWKSRNDAVTCPKGDIKLAFCPQCTFVSNIAIEPQKNQYDRQYDNSLFYSNQFQEFARKLATTLVERYNLHEKNIVEIGGGKVDFLSLFVSLGKNCGERFDPFCAKARAANQAESAFSSVLKSFPFVNENKKPDFIFSYHELEHMNDPVSFLKSLRQVLGKNLSTRLFFSVPNSLKDFEEGEYSDIIYEHVSYFTVPSLYFLFSSCGFDILNVEETEREIFDSIYVNATIKTERSSSFKSISETEVNKVEKSILEFSAKTNKNISRLCTRITKLLDEDNKIVIWGAGARGVTFLNIFKDQRIKYAVDINPRKQDMFVPGTGQKIVKPEFLVEYQPDFIILANPSYKKEIKRFTDSKGIDSRFILI
jgi:hypothetical protein